MIRVATIVALVLSLAPSAEATIRWRFLADGPTPGSPVSKTSAFVALSRAGTAVFATRLGDAGTANLARVKFSADAVVAIFGEFGCRDESIVVSSVLQVGTKLKVSLVEQPPKPGTMQCMAIYGTYRLLLVAKSLLRQPYPTRAEVTLARA